MIRKLWFTLSFHRSSYQCESIGISTNPNFFYIDEYMFSLVDTPWKTKHASCNILFFTREVNKDEGAHQTTLLKKLLKKLLGGCFDYKRRIANGKRVSINVKNLITKIKERSC